MRFPLDCSGIILLRLHAYKIILTRTRKQPIFIAKGLNEFAPERENAMADDMNGKSGGDQLPPKIVLHGTAAGDARQGASRPKKPTVRIGKPSEPKKSTSKIDLSEASVPAQFVDLSKAATMPIAIPSQPAETKKAGPARTEPEPPITPLSEAEKSAAVKKATVRIEIPSDIQPAGVEDALEAAKKTTARVIIDEERAKGDTARIGPVPPELAQSAKKRTARIDLGETPAEDQDIFKRRTAVFDPSKLAEARGEVPRTIRIKRPEGAAPTTEISPIVPPPPQEVDAARKSETARIELPAEAAPVAQEQPPTRKKTIKIKRPGATAAATPIVITRPTEEAKPEAAVGAAEGQPHPAFAWVALVAVIITVLLVYVLLAQVGTAPELLSARLPWPGRL